MFTTIYKEGEISSGSVPFYVTTCDIIVQHHRTPVCNKLLSLRPHSSSSFKGSANLEKKLKILINPAKITSLQITKQSNSLILHCMCNYQETQCAGYIIQPYILCFVINQHLHLELSSVECLNGIHHVLVTVCPWERMLFFPAHIEQRKE